MHHHVILDCVLMSPDCTCTIHSYPTEQEIPPGRVLPLCWVIWMCRHFDPLFWHSGDWTRSFWGTFSHPPTPKPSFGVLKLPILTKFDLFGPTFHFSLNLFGSNFQWPAAHTRQFSDRVTPPRGNPPMTKQTLIRHRGWFNIKMPSHQYRNSHYKDEVAVGCLIFAVASSSIDGFVSPSIYLYVCVAVRAF